jgi:hypothetical protein|eukprot:COSAG01_NODE_4726_length_4789_cov_12.625160_4_plen_149_part_00
MQSYCSDPLSLVTGKRSSSCTKIGFLCGAHAWIVHPGSDTALYYNGADCAAVAAGSGHARSQFYSCAGTRQRFTIGYRRVAPHTNHILPWLQLYGPLEQWLVNTHISGLWCISLGVDCLASAGIVTANVVDEEDCEVCIAFVVPLCPS